MTIYAFEFCSCTFTGEHSIYSLHKTKAGAYKAMREHKLLEWESHTQFGFDPLEFGLFMRWRIKPYVVHD